MYAKHSYCGSIEYQVNLTCGDSQGKGIQPHDLVSVPAQRQPLRVVET